MPNKKITQLKIASVKGYRPQKLGQRLFKCPLCEYSSVFRSAITGHIPSHSDERPYVCNMCSYNTKRSGDLQKHKHTKHFQPLKSSNRSKKGSKSTGLMICETDQLLDNNINEALKMTPFAFGDMLGNENMSASSSSSYRRSSGTVNSYGDIQGATLQNISVACQDDGVRTGNGKRGNTASGGRSWNCQFCPIIFLDRALYFMHMGLHGVPNPWKCNLCHGVYNDVYGFTSHIINGHEAR